MRVRCMRLCGRFSLRVCAPQAACAAQCAQTITGRRGVRQTTKAFLEDAHLQRDATQQQEQYELQQHLLSAAALAAHATDETPREFLARARAVLAVTLQRGNAALQLHALTSQLHCTTSTPTSERRRTRVRPPHCGPTARAASPGARPAISDACARTDARRRGGGRAVLLTCSCCVLYSLVLCSTLHAHIRAQAGKQQAPGPAARRHAAALAPLAHQALQASLHVEHGPRTRLYSSAPVSTRDFNGQVPARAQCMPGLREVAPASPDPAAAASAAVAAPTAAAADSSAR